MLIFFTSIAFSSCSKSNDVLIEESNESNLKKQLYSIPEAKPNPELEEKVKRFKITSSLDYIHSEILLRDPISYSSEDLKENLINAINLDYSSGFASTAQTHIYIDSISIPIQGTTFNENSAAYALDYLQYKIKERYNELGVVDAKLTYLNLNETVIASGSQKFYITTSFGTYEALPPIVFPDITYNFRGYSFGGILDQDAIHSVLERAVNNNYGLPGTPSNVYLSNYKTIGVKTLDNTYTFDGSFVEQVDVYTEVPNNPLFVHKDCITETKIMNRPMQWRSVNISNWITYKILGKEYNKNEVVFYYGKALEFFNAIKPNGNVFVRSKMAYDRTLSSPFFWNNENGVLNLPPYKYDCANLGRCQLVNAGVQAYYGVYAKLNYRTGPSLPLNHFTGGEPNKADYNL